MNGHYFYNKQPTSYPYGKTSDSGHYYRSLIMDQSFGSGSSSIESGFGPPLDYSYRNISNLSRLDQRYPRQSLRKQRRSPSGRYSSNVLKLANNNLVDTVGLYKMAVDVIENPEDIGWLDLSFNHITAISEDILEFPALKQISLHGNQISSFKDLEILRRLPNLKSITLYGNAIENYPNYRSTIIFMFPQLDKLDLAKVTEGEKDSAKLQIIVSKNGNGRGKQSKAGVKKYSL